MKLSIALSLILALAACADQPPKKRLPYPGPKASQEEWLEWMRENNPGHPIVEPYSLEEQALIEEGGGVREGIPEPKTGLRR